MSCTHNHTPVASFVRSLQSVAAFVGTAEASSFAGAARRLGLSTSAVSKAVAKLEADLGVRLFHRTTRSVSLTPEGSTFFGRARAVLDELAEAEAEVAGARGAPRGRLRVAAPPSLWRAIALPMLPRFCARYPRIQLDLVMNDAEVDLAAQGVDLALRVGPPRDARLIAPLLREQKLVLVCGLDYLRRHKAPRRPEDLHEHRLIGVRFASEGRMLDWQLAVDGAIVVHRIDPVLVVDAGDAVLDLAVAGLGIAQVPDLIVASALAAGRLVQVLPGCASPGPPVHAVYLPGATRLPKTDVFLRALRAAGAEAPPA